MGNVFFVLYSCLVLLLGACGDRRVVGCSGSIILLSGHDFCTFGLYPITWFFGRQVARCHCVCDSFYICIICFFCQSVDFWLVWGFVVGYRFGGGTIFLSLFYVLGLFLVYSGVFFFFFLYFPYVCVLAR